MPALVRELTGGGAPKAVNAAPGQAATTLQAVADGGRLATITGDPPGEERGVAVTDLYVRPDGRQLSALAELLANGALSVPIASVRPLEEASFDLVLCLFGVMFFPDKVRANAEAHRVLRPGGRYVVVTFDSLDLNPVPQAAGDAVASRFPDDPRYMERGPFSYTDIGRLEQDLLAAGFQTVELETVGLSSPVTARDAAHGIVLGSPFRAEIERLDASALERATAAVEQALRPWDGGNAPMSAHIATATR